MTTKQQKKKESGGLAPELVKIEKLSPDPANVRKHSGRNIEAIKASLRRFGQQKPIVVNSNNMVVAGNGTLEAAVELGWEEIAVVCTDLEGSEAVAFALADNRTAELAAWDFQALGDQVQKLLGEGIDLDSIGWLPHEIEPLLQADWEPEELEPLEPSEDKDKSTTISVRADELEVINRAFDGYKKNSGGSPNIGEALKSICTSWLSEQ